ncbi:oxamate carbamoyltransferase subunit AllH family protein [Bradyrhizobium sp. AZCC 1693]|uniref:oxamate carbamoyltransferase subunit AllH family protein n=1 Tax=Bradyrhizobium sp. AZCC 1693 TaxID=3117029 RepID=UPI002FF0B1E4
MGLLAKKVLRNGAAGQVVTVFERSFYATLGGNWICVGRPDIGSGPLHLLGNFDLSRPAIGDAVRVAESILWVAGAPLAELASASVWAPSAVPRWSEGSLRRGLHAVDEIWRGDLTAGGLASAGSGRTPVEAASALVQAARPGLVALERIVARSAGESDNMSGLGGLIGLGPGLTPSGDDLIGGALIALAALDHTERRDVLWGRCLTLIAHTNDISRIHLQAAALGYGAAALHAAIHVVMSGQTARLHHALKALTAVGHTSGLDAFAGSLIVLRHAIRKQ